jgi:hypothetical protein
MKTTLPFLLVILVFSLISLNSQARPAYFNVLMKDYPKAGTTTRCTTCHQGAGLNPFGRDVARYALTSGVLNLRKVDDMDSDKDGMSNRDELLQGKNPGVATSAVNNFR